MPALDWVRAPAPEITPEAVSVPLWMKLTVPASATALVKVEPLASFSASVAPLATLVAELEEIDPEVPLPICKVPALTVVVPV